VVLPVHFVDGGLLYLVQTWVITLIVFVTPVISPTFLVVPTGIISYTFSHYNALPSLCTLHTFIRCSLVDTIWYDLNSFPRWPLLMQFTNIPLMVVKFCVMFVIIVLQLFIHSVRWWNGAIYRWGVIILISPVILYILIGCVIFGNYFIPLFSQLYSPLLSSLHSRVVLVTVNYHAGISLFSDSSCLRPVLFIIPVDLLPLLPPVPWHQLIDVMIHLTGGVVEWWSVTVIWKVVFILTLFLVWPVFCCYRWRPVVILYDTVQYLENLVFICCGYSLLLLLLLQFILLLMHWWLFVVISIVVLFWWYCSFLGRIWNSDGGGTVDLRWLLLWVFCSLITGRL